MSDSPTPEEFEEEPYTRESTWGSNDNRQIKIKDLENRHLVNIVHFLNHSEKHKHWHRRSEFLRILNEEIKLRALPREYVDKAPYPFKDEHGTLKTWSYERNRIVEIPLSIQLITEFDS